MDGAPFEEDIFLQERRRRLAAERMLEHVRDELLSAHRSLAAHVERVSGDYRRERKARLQLSGQAERVTAERQAADMRAARSGRRLWHAVEAIRDGFALWDPEGRLIQANPTFELMFDGALETRPGMPFEELIRAAADEGIIDVGDGDPDDWVDHMLERHDHETPEPVMLRLYDGRSIRFQDRRTEDGDVVTFAMDITADVERETFLNRARREAEAANKAKSRFLARMSHEFRTPMNGVIGISDLLLEGALDDEARLYVETIRDSGVSLLDIVNDVLDAARLESGQLTLRPAAFDLEQTLMQVVRLAGASGGSVASVALDYPLGVPTRFHGDEARIRQIVTNLIGNAVKFAADCDITLAVTITRPDGADTARVAIEVSDTGPGIPADRRDTVFGEFARLEPGKVEGAGLGLSIARDLARLMGGDLTLLAEDGNEDGARFCLTVALPISRAWPEAPNLPPEVAVTQSETLGTRILRARLRAAGVKVVSSDVLAGATQTLLVPLDVPLEQQAVVLKDLPSETRLVILGPRSAAAPEMLSRADAVLPNPCEGSALIAALSGASRRRTEAVETVPKPNSVRLLAADDVATNRLLIQRMLAAEGRELEVVDDGDVAVERFAEAPFDVVLLDISMPRMDGREAARLIRATSEGADVPIIAMTAHADPEEVEDIRKAGIDEVLIKPVRKPELNKVIARLAPRFAATVVAKA